MSAAAKPPVNYARFIPREELGSFAAWKPGALSGEPQPAASAAAAATPHASGVRAAPPAAPASTDQSRRAELAAARQSGYQDGYRDGLVALDGFKQSYAAQLTSQFAALHARFDGELMGLEAEIATAVAQTAVKLARQVLRSELAADPARVARVATEAVDAVLLSARRITVRVHPLDHALVATGAAEELQSRGARLHADPTVDRGGCIVDSDLGMVDARIATRWAQAAGALGSGERWRGDEPGDEPGGDA